MSHNRTYDWEHTFLTLTSCSSVSSVEFYEEKLKPGIEEVGKTSVPLQDLAFQAETLITEMFAPDPRSIYRYRNDSTEISMALDKVMLSMLACVEQCGGENRKRYVTSAIMVCSKQEDVVAALEFLVKTDDGQETLPTRGSVGIATPTADKTTTDFLEEGKSGKNTFAADVMRRDGYTCVITGVQDKSYPEPRDVRPRVHLEAAHILRREIGHFNSNHTSKSFKSAATTFHILVNFTRLPVNTLEELHERLDQPENGIVFQHDAHDGFDSYYWCMKQTEKENVYDLKIFNPDGLWQTPGSSRISFEDHSNDFSAENTRKRNRPIDLPNPQYIAIHAAIAGILNMSGAGKFFDELLDRYRDNDGKVPGVPSYPELETVMLGDVARQSLVDLFQIVEVK